MDQGTTWLGEYTRWSFDEDKSYIMVAKEMKNPTTDAAVPLLDSELNEQAEINLTLLRRAIERCFGNGTLGDGFKIVQAASTTNNFSITGGDGTTAGAGYIFVAGWMPFLATSMDYTAQDSPAALTTPSAPRTDYVYIDVYLDEYGPDDDVEVIDPYIGTETSRRLKLCWEVKVAEGTAVPADGLDADNIYHWRHPLATLSRTASSAITTAMILDTRNADRLNPAGTRTYAGSPVGHLTPQFLGEEAFDTVGDDFYKAVGATSSDWKQITA